MIFTFCKQQNKEESVLFSLEEIVIPSTVKNKNDINFKLENGILFFANQAYSGVVNEYYSAGNLKSESEYYQGKREGKYLGFYPNNQKSFERLYTNGLKSGIHFGWYLNKIKKFEYHFNNKGAYNGSIKDWFANGVLAKHFNFIEGKEAGSQKMWNSKGEIRANFYTVKNERHGLIGLKKCVSVPHNKTVLVK